MFSRSTRIAILAAAALTAALAAGLAAAQPAARPRTQASPVHPTFALLDAAGQAVLASGGPVSPLATCGQCHDTAFIQQHDTHAQATLSTAPATGAIGGWDALLNEATPAAAGEPNCFLCHLAAPDDAARRQALAAGETDWAATATLASTGLVTPTATGWQWNAAAFAADGTVARETLALQDPADANCGLCHGAVHAAAEPVVAAGCALEQPLTATTGQVVSPARVADSGVNLAGKDGLARAWDVHAERDLHCTDCHFAPNNPAHTTGAEDEAAEHLVYDPRRLDVGEYVQRPSHDLSAGVTCTDCHAAEVAHRWLPYADQHLDALACETCHVPRAYAPALQEVDWTVLTPDGGPRTACRGVDGQSGTPADLVTGFTPALLARGTAAGDAQLAPYNLVTTWAWYYDAADGQARPVSQSDLQAAFFAPAGGYAPDVLAALDADGDGQVATSELVLDTPAKQAVIASRLKALGLANPRVAGEVRAFALNHTVTTGEWATGDCQACHTDDSRLAQPVALGSLRPGGTLPTFGGGDGAAPAGDLHAAGNVLSYAAETSAEGRYVFGHDRAAWADWLGALAFVGVLAAVAGHGGLRAYAALRAPRPAPGTRRVYMYAVYERFWHWLQTFTIVLLLFTGLIIHRPDLFAVFSFRHVVLVHNVLAAVLVINAALALFYHLASGEIRQFLPRPYGFFDQAIGQAKFYLRGIFRGARHPFEKTPARKLNPLQQITYFGILNVLLPLQIVTGALMWGAQQWPQAAARLGGLALLAPVHSLVAWLFGAFVVAHVYLTTTGHAPLAGIQAMINGWEDVEHHALGQEVSEHEHPQPGPGADAAPAPAGAD